MKVVQVNLNLKGAPGPKDRGGGRGSRCGPGCDVKLKRPEKSKSGGNI